MIFRRLCLRQGQPTPEYRPPVRLRSRGIQRTGSAPPPARRCGLVYSILTVLGGEVAVPCTRNPL